METGRDDTAWVKVQLQELSNRWDTVCALSVTKQTRLQQALKQVRKAAAQLLSLSNFSPHFSVIRQSQIHKKSSVCLSGGGLSHSGAAAPGVALRGGADASFPRRPPRRGGDSAGAAPHTPGLHGHSGGEED